MNLYRLINGIDTFYVVAKSPTHAQERLHTLLHEADYGFAKDQQVKQINLIAEGLSFYNDEPRFCEDQTHLILVEDV